MQQLYLTLPFLQVIQKIEAQGVKSGSVKHIKYPPIIVDCGIVEEKEEGNGAVEENEEKAANSEKNCDSCAKDYAAVSG